MANNKIMQLYELLKNYDPKITSPKTNIGKEVIKKLNSFLEEIDCNSIPLFKIGDRVILDNKYKAIVSDIVFLGYKPYYKLKSGEVENPNLWHESFLKHF
jgi:hypothetical protein